MSASGLAKWQPEIAVVLGSGLSPLLRRWKAQERFRYSDFPEMPTPTVPGHAAEFVLIECAGRRLIFACGRVHLYEGHSARDVTAGVRLLAGAGVRSLILTNAAGSLHPQFAPGSWMMIHDHLNLTNESPLTGVPTFLDLSSAYSPRLRDVFRNSAARRHADLQEGVYACVRGPQYETGAEVRMLRTLGADVVGMSTVLEAIQARALNLEIAAFSCITNWAAGVGGPAPSHDDVLSTSASAADLFGGLLEEALPQI